MKVCLMTCPERIGLPQVSRLRDMLPDWTITYVDEEGRGPAWNAERIIFDSQDCSDGILLLQDDIIIEPWFMDEVYKSMIPGEAMSYHLPWDRVKDWYDQGYSYARIWHIWGQANYYPQWLLHGYWRWVQTVPPLPPRGPKTCVKTSNVPEDFAYRKWCGDDSSMTACLMWLGRRPYLTLPNLCQHDVGMGSTIRPKVDEGWQTKVFGKDLLRPWDLNRVFDESFFPAMSSYVHPSQKAKYLTP